MHGVDTTAKDHYNDLSCRNRLDEANAERSNHSKADGAGINVTSGRENLGDATDMQGLSCILPSEMNLMALMKHEFNARGTNMPTMRSNVPTSTSALGSLDCMATRTRHPHSRATQKLEGHVSNTI